MTNFLITAESVPVLDGWGFDDYWLCNDWITWHKLMKDKYGLDYANTKLITAFESQSIGASGIDCRSLDGNFKQYAKDNGFYDALFTGIGGLLASGISAGQSGSSAVTGGIENISDTAKDTTKYASYIIPIALGLILLAITYAIINNINKTSNNVRSIVSK